MPTLTAEHNLTPDELSKALATLADAEDISEELVKAIKKKSACDDTPKEPRQPAVREAYHLFQRECDKALYDIERYIKEMLNGSDRGTA